MISNLKIDIIVEVSVVILSKHRHSLVLIVLNLVDHVLLPFGTPNGLGGHLLNFLDSLDCFPSDSCGIHVAEVGKVVDAVRNVLEGFFKFLQLFCFVLDFVKDWDGFCYVSDFVLGWVD